MARARRTDPQTSHEAAERVDDVTKVQNVILEILDVRGDATDPQIAEHYYSWVSSGYAPNHSESGLRTRRKELTDKGYIRDSGEKMLLDTGRYAVVWERVTRS